MKTFNQKGYIVEETKKTMESSINKTLLIVSTLAITVISIQYVPFSREKELSNHCREWYSLSKDKNMEHQLSIKSKTISRKTGLKKENIKIFCNSFYFNQI